jgi:hypothetical protein
MPKCSRCKCSKDTKEFKAPKTCIKCSEHIKEKRKRDTEASQKWRTENRERLRVYNKAWRTSYKSYALQHYRIKCRCCGENDIRFLTIDHVNGGGVKHRKELGTGAGASFYHWLKTNNYPEGYAVLCFNCNCGRSVNGGVCPHKEDKLSLE